MPLHVVLYQPQIPPNTGNIARLCVATRSVLHLIHPLGFSTDDSQLKRAGLDYWAYLDIRHHRDWESFLQEKGEGKMFFFSKKCRRPYTRAEYREGDFLVFGSETSGLPDEMRRRYEADLYTIPMWGETRSINLATSTGIVLYEALRQVHGGF